MNIYLSIIIIMIMIVAFIIICKKVHRVLYFIRSLMAPSYNLTPTKQHLNSKACWQLSLFGMGLAKTNPKHCATVQNLQELNMGIRQSKLIWVLVLKWYNTLSRLLGWLPCRTCRYLRNLSVPLPVTELKSKNKPTCTMNHAS